jgi:hypothetical protein
MLGTGAQPEISIVMTKKILIAFSLLGFVAACGGPGENAEVPEALPAGDSFSDIGDHVVHFNAITTDQLPAEYARNYGITRSPNSAMLNVSIIDEADDLPVAGDVSVKVVNLTSQLKDVEIRRIDEPGTDDTFDAIYYVGIVDIRNREVLVFDVTVKPEGVDKAESLRFTRQFFTD